MLAIITLIFASVALLSGALLYPLLDQRTVIRKRVEKLINQEKEQQPVLVHTRTKWQTFLADMGNKLRTKPADLRTYRERITAAGFRKESVYIFLGSKLLLAAVLPALYLVFALPQTKTAGSASLLLVMACAISGYLMPTFWLSKRAENRKTEIFHSLPDVLDLLTVCVEAGLSLDAALIKTAENFQHTRNPLIKEINMVTLEIRAGKARSEALKSLAERTMVDDIKAFVSMLVQTEKFGTSLGKTLRTYSDSLRMKRKQLAEERAAKTAVKMLLPLTFCVFPALLVVMLVPAFFKIYAMFDKH